MEQFRFIEIDAGVRYWEDALLNGIADHEARMPLREGNRWKPIIELDSGHIVNWPQGVQADIHYKICDDGQYWLLDQQARRIAQWRGYYVPDDILCIDDQGYGDYIIFSVGANGHIVHWKKPCIKHEQWQAMSDNRSVGQP